jgi:hypothetical protein
MPSVATVEGTKTLVAEISSKGACKGDMGACFFEAKLDKKLHGLVESTTSGSSGASTKSSANPKPSTSSEMEFQRTSRDATISSCASGNKGEGLEEHSGGT